MNQRIKIFIVLSVMLNVLFSGLFFGFIFKYSGLGFKNEKIIETTLAKAPIPAERRLFLESQINAIFENGHNSHKEIDKIREDAFKILIAESFNEDSYQAQMDKMFALHNNQEKTMGEAIKNLAKQLDAKERLALAEILRSMRKKH